MGERRKHKGGKEGKEEKEGRGPAAGRETYLEVERRGLVFGIKGRVLTSLLEQSVQLLSFLILEKKMLAQTLPTQLQNPFLDSFLPSLREEKEKERK